MKLNHIIFGAAFILAQGLISCSDQMDYHEFKVNDEDYIKRDFGNTGKITTHIYRALPSDWGNFSGAMAASATDEAVYSHQGNSVETFFNGAWGPTNAMSSTWSTAWDAIAYCNLFLDRFNNLTFPEHELEKGYADEMIKYNNLQWEVRFMRAYHYFLLVRQYGGVPLVTSYMNADESNAMPRVKADTIFDYIDKELVAIQDTIIKNYTGAYVSLENETGRVNMFGVMALRAQASLYHASPLFSQGKSDAEKKALWEHAAECHQAALDSLRKYSYTLCNSYEALFATSNWQETQPQKEIIFATRTAASSAMESRNFPVGMANGNGGNCPTENLVSAYEMTNGLPITDPKSGYDPQNPYKNRDPRFAATIAVNGEKWPNYLPTNALETWYGGANSRSVTYGTPTGYYLKKYVNREQKISGSGATTTTHTWILFRVGQLYLDFAEVMLNLTGSGYATQGRYTRSAADFINDIRTRVKLPKLPEGLSFDEFTKRYENERFVELAFEGHRMFDVRRWMKAPEYFLNIKCMEITKEADGTLVYNTVVNPSYITKRNWDDRYYLWPIPQADILKSGVLTQNPGWGGNEEDTLK